MDLIKSDYAHFAKTMNIATLNEMAYSKNACMLSTAQNYVISWFAAHFADRPQSYLPMCVVTDWVLKKKPHSPSQWMPFSLLL